MVSVSETQQKQAKPLPEQLEWANDFQSWLVNTSALATANLSVFKSVFVPILTFSHAYESGVMTERISEVQAAEIGFCKEFTVWFFVTKCTAVYIYKASSVEPLLNLVVKPHLQ